MNDSYNRAIELGVDPNDIEVTIKVKNAGKYLERIEADCAKKGLFYTDLYRNSKLKATTQSHWRRNPTTKCEMPILLSVLEFLQGR